MTFRPLTPENYAKVARAREVIRRRGAYFMPIIYKFVPVDMELPEGAGMLVTEHLIVGTDREHLESVPTEKLATLLVHEACHVWLEHIPRSRKVNVRWDVPWERDSWLSAVDFSINPMLRDAGWAIPQWRDLPASWQEKYKHARKDPEDPCMIFPSDVTLPDGTVLQDGLTAEEYYNILLRLVVVIRVRAGQTPEEARAQHEKEFGPIDPGKNVYLITDSIGDGQCGSVTGDRATGEAPPTPEGRSKEDVRAAVNAASQQALAAKKGGQGVPGLLQVWSEMTLGVSKVPWGAKLQRLLKQTESWLSGHGEVTYARVSKRQAAVGYGHGRPILPSLRRPEFSLLFAIDSSASMSAREGGDVLTEAEAIMRQFNCVLDVVVCDAAIEAVAKISSISDAIKNLKGGGATDFRPIFSYIEKLPKKRRPRVAIIGTDGGGEAPPHAPPGVAVIWLLVGRHRQRPWSRLEGAITWGEFIEVNHGE